MVPDPDSIDPLRRQPLQQVPVELRPWCEPATQVGKCVSLVAHGFDTKPWGAGVYYLQQGGTGEACSGEGCEKSLWYVPLGEWLEAEVREDNASAELDDFTHLRVRLDTGKLTIHRIWDASWGKGSAPGGCLRRVPTRPTADAESTSDRLLAEVSNADGSHAIGLLTIRQSSSMPLVSFAPLCTTPAAASSVDAAWCNGELVVCALVPGGVLEMPPAAAAASGDRPGGGTSGGAEEGDDPDSIVVTRAFASQNQASPPAEVYCWRPGTGLAFMGQVPKLCEDIKLAKGGEGCTLKFYLNAVPEEAERGEFVYVDLRPDAKRSLSSCSSRVQVITRAAGRVAAAAASTDFIVIQANWEETRPITTHLGLWFAPTVVGNGSTEVLPSAKWLPVPGFGSDLALTAEAEASAEGGLVSLRGRHVEFFEFLADGLLCVTTVDGARLESHLVLLDTIDTLDAKRLPFPVWQCLDAGFLADQSTESVPSVVLFASQDAANLPRIVCGRQLQRWCKVELSPPAGPADASSPAAAFHDFETHGPFPLLQALPPGMAGPAADPAKRVCYVEYSRRGVTRPDSPILIHAHGGPAVAFPQLKANACDLTRYPLRPYLSAGYRVVFPYYRGTLGFGDAFAQGNIGVQGINDLGDIVACISDLKRKYPAVGGNFGIFGGSYGGYMTIRAMARFPGLFKVGVALYGFVHNRWMSFEGGDYTWEDEYINIPQGFDPELRHASPAADGTGAADFDFDAALAGLVGGGPAGSSGGAVGGGVGATRLPVASKTFPSSSIDRFAASPIQSPPVGDKAAGAAGAAGAMSPSDVWPLPPGMQGSDTMDILHRVGRPLLFIHGLADDICPPSQSRVAFHVLEKQRVPTGLVEYKGEGHGFNQAKHQRDRDCRMLLWFLKYMPPPKGA